MGPEALAQVLRPLAGMFSSENHPELLRGLDPPDDAAVWRLDATRALCLTGDFFPPVVDHPYHYGAIAAANALSDLYAMGADVLLAINLVSFPENLDRLLLGEILRGGARKVHEAGGVVAGGHTTTDPEPKYGLAAVGMGHPDRILTTAGAQPGDVLFLTKPVGTGVITTAHKKDRVEPAHLDEAIASMSRLNKGAALLLRDLGKAVHAVTDVTGFSLVGHAHEMALQSGVSLRLDWFLVPRLAGAMDYADMGLVTGGGRRNREHYGAHVAFDGELLQPELEVLYDPQTSGGLLIAVDRAHADPTQHLFEHAKEPLWRIGVVMEGPPGRIVVA